MEKELQDLSWACLPKETRHEMRKMIASESDNDAFDEGYDNALFDFFGPHNLTSDTEPAEMLTVKRAEMQRLFSSTQNITDPASESFIKGKLSAYYEIFGDKCLPDKMNIPSSGGGMNTTPPSYKLDVKESHHSANMGKCADGVEAVQGFGRAISKTMDSASIAVPTVYGHLEHEPTKHLISVYSKIGWFKRLMLRWCFGLRYVKHDNRTK